MLCSMTPSAALLGSFVLCFTLVFVSLLVLVSFLCFAALFPFRVPLPAVWLWRLAAMPSAGVFACLASVQASLFADICFSGIPVLTGIEFLPLASALVFNGQEG